MSPAAGTPLPGDRSGTDRVDLAHLTNPVLLLVAVAAISTSGPIIAASTAPALAMAFWRCGLGAVLTAPWVWWRRRGEWSRLGRRHRQATILAGLLLGAHFAVWIPSLRFTSVASSAALVATQPVWAALIARARGTHIPGRTWAGIGVALLGVAVLTGADVRLDARALVGDGLALAGAVFAAAYVTVGAQVRPRVSTPTYTTAVYATAAVALLVACLVGGQPLVGYSARDWGLILALTAGAQLIGHTLINKVLVSLSATLTSLAILLELPGSALIAAVWLGQAPPAAVWPAGGLILAGLALVVTAGRRPSAVTAAIPAG